VLARGIAVEYGTGPLKVLAVVPGLPGAKAGLATGDVIIDADGRRTDGFSPAEWDALDAKPGVLQLAVQHGGARKRVDVPVVTVVQ